MGETLVDFLPTTPGRPVSDVEGWVPCPGGSPANVAIGVQRLGGRAAMLGVVGEDGFGAFLRTALGKEGVDVSHLRTTTEGRTGLVFITLTEGGERSFHDFRTRSAETLLGHRDVDVDFVTAARVLHIGSNSLILPEAREATDRHLDAMVANDRIVSCDPNLRLGFWPDPAPLKGILERLLPRSTVVKLAEDELEFVTGETEPEKALAQLASLGIPLAIVTRGEHGAMLRFQGKLATVEAPRATVVDATGAGDGFVAAMLRGLSSRFATRNALESEATLEELTGLARFACACASRVVTQLGAVRGLPFASDVRAVAPSFALR